MTGVPDKSLGPARRYQMRQVGCMAAYVLLLGLVSQIFRTSHPEGALRYFLAALPALPLLGVVLAIAAYLMEESDEFKRMKTVLVLLGGLGVTLVVTTVWGFLEAFAGAPHFEAWWVFIVFCLGLLPSGAIVAWKYR